MNSRQPLPVSRVPLFRVMEVLMALRVKMASRLAGQGALDRARLGNHLLLMCLMAAMMKWVGLGSWTSWGWVMLWILPRECSIKL